MKRDSKYSAVITALGMYFPDKVYDNKYFESIVETNDEWIVSRTGIKERRSLKMVPQVILRQEQLRI